jgi:hypothetical protein
MAMVGLTMSVMRTEPTVFMTLPIEVIQQIYLYLSVHDYNAARRTCRSWRYASLGRRVLNEMLKRGGWRASIHLILPSPQVPDTINPCLVHTMSKWISRECDLADPQGSSFEEVGYTDFRPLMSNTADGEANDLAFTVSLCGHFLMVARDKQVFLYELSHTCHDDRSRWAMPLRNRVGLPLGVLRPITTVICPCKVLSCSMDTSSGRNTAGFLMEGRLGLICDIDPEKLGPRIFNPNTASRSVSRSTSGSSSATSACVCRGLSFSQRMPVKDGLRSLYRNICYSDEPPLVVAVCPQRNCVAFGSSSGIELHWIDARTGRDMSKWFPLPSPSHYLYFLPRRRGLDSAKRLRLISSVAQPPRTETHDERALRIRAKTTSILTSSGSTSDRSGCETPQASPWPFFGRGQRRIGRGEAKDSDHYHALPLSDGHHILFTDTQSGSLCLGADAPAGSLTRLVRKIWFRPPPRACSLSPVIYAASADLVHGVRVVAAFTAQSGTSGSGAVRSEEQLVIFYTVAPDIFHNLNERNPLCETYGTYKKPCRQPGSSEWLSWWPRENMHDSGVLTDPFVDNTSHQLKISGQMVGTGRNLVDVAVDASPELTIWVFSADGWAKTWAMKAGGSRVARTQVQGDGSLHHVDEEDHVLPPGNLITKDEGIGPCAYDGASTQGREMEGIGPWAHRLRYTRPITWTHSRISGTGASTTAWSRNWSGITDLDLDLR